MQRVNGACCQSMRAVRRVRAASSIHCWNQHDRGITRDGRGKMPVFGQQHPILFNAMQGECSVGKPTFGNDRVITGRNHRPRSRSISSHKNRGNGLTLSL